MMAPSNGNVFRVTGTLCGEIQRSLVNSPHKGQWRGALMFSLNKRLSKQSWGWWFETPSRSLRRHCNVLRNNGMVIWCTPKLINLAILPYTSTCTSHRGCRTGAFCWCILWRSDKGKKKSIYALTVFIKKTILGHLEWLQAQTGQYPTVNCIETEQDVLNHSCPGVVYAWDSS